MVKEYNRVGKGIKNGRKPNRHRNTRRVRNTRCRNTRRVKKTNNKRVIYNSKYGGSAWTRIKRLGQQLLGSTDTDTEQSTSDKVSTGKLASKHELIDKLAKKGGISKYEASELLKQSDWNLETVVNVLFSPDESTSTNMARLPGVPLSDIRGLGIVNPKFQCYLISLVQCLTSNPIIVDYLKTKNDEVARKDVNDPVRKIIESLVKIADRKIELIDSGEYHVINFDDDDSPIKTIKELFDGFIDGTLGSTAGGEIEPHISDPETLNTWLGVLSDQQDQQEVFSILSELFEKIGLEDFSRLFVRNIFQYFHCGNCGDSGDDLGPVTGKLNIREYHKTADPIMLKIPEEGEHISIVKLLNAYFSHDVSDSYADYDCLNPPGLEEFKFLRYLNELNESVGLGESIDKNTLNRILDDYLRKLKQDQNEIYTMILENICNKLKLPSHWEEYLDDNDIKFYYNTVTKVSTYEHPTRRAGEESIDYFIYILKNEMDESVFFKHLNHPDKRVELFAKGEATIKDFERIKNEATLANCQHNGGKIKFFKINEETLPPILMLHINRTSSWGSGKLNYPVNINGSIDLSPYSEDIDAPKRYTLSCITYHSGETARVGHYYCDCLIKGRWYRFSDRLSNILSDDYHPDNYEINQRQCCLLFYQLDGAEHSEPMAGSLGGGRCRLYKKSRRRTKRKTNRKKKNKRK